MIRLARAFTRAAYDVACAGALLVLAILVAGFGFAGFVSFARFIARLVQP